ncbi:hypothetical protein TL16_g03144 [Triparma laevis f. inornata]|uniref:Uncharacterized protein n=1 Tax=Triparma laevis f. inornata TaxID=1714386 RepID=A0A9W7DY61_9STRA|nr:hypothetical protein TL16_g03144 [Triparma laevis f. inornata]
MSKTVATESIEGHESREMSGKRGAGDEEKQDEEDTIEATSTANSTTLSTVSTAPAAVDDFMNTIEFMILFFPFVRVQTLMALRILNKEWNGVVDALINEGVESGELFVHDGNNVCEDSREYLVTRVISF